MTTTTPSDIQTMHAYVRELRQQVQATQSAVHAAEEQLEELDRLVSASAVRVPAIGAPRYWARQVADTFHAVDTVELQPGLWLALDEVNDSLTDMQEALHQQREGITVTGADGSQVIIPSAVVQTIQAQPAGPAELYDVPAESMPTLVSPPTHTAGQPVVQFTDAGVQ